MICKLGEILRERGLKKGWLAERVGVSNGTVGDWINKGRIPELPVAYSVAEILGLTVYDIWIKSNK